MGRFVFNWQVSSWLQHRSNRVPCWWQPSHWNLFRPKQHPYFVSSRNHSAARLRCAIATNQTRLALSQATALDEFAPRAAASSFAFGAVNGFRLIPISFHRKQRISRSHLEQTISHQGAFNFATDLKSIAWNRVGKLTERLEFSRRRC